MYCYIIYYKIYCLHFFLEHSESHTTVKWQTDTEMDNSLESWYIVDELFVCQMDTMLIIYISRLTGYSLGSYQRVGLLYSGYCSHH